MRFEEMKPDDYRRAKEAAPRPEGSCFPRSTAGIWQSKPHAGFDCTLEFSAECVKLLVREQSNRTIPPSCHPWKGGR